jgi:hypothetical protein
MNKIVKTSKPVSFVTVKARYNDMFGFRQIGRCNEFVSVMNLVHNSPTDRHDGHSIMPIGLLYVVLPSMHTVL